jgi:hypothetical protein
MVSHTAILAWVTDSLLRNITRSSSTVVSRLYRSLFPNPGGRASAGLQADGPAWQYYWHRFAEEQLAESVHGDPVGYLQSLQRTQPLFVLSLGGGSGRARDGEEVSCPLRDHVHRA